jgi:hypothetical protein
MSSVIEALLDIQIARNAARNAGTYIYSKPRRDSTKILEISNIKF